MIIFINIADFFSCNYFSKLYLLPFTVLIIKVTKMATEKELEIDSNHSNSSNLEETFSGKDTIDLDKAKDDNFYRKSNDKVNYDTNQNSVLKSEVPETSKYQNRLSSSSENKLDDAHNNKLCRNNSYENFTHHSLSKPRSLMETLLVAKMEAATLKTNPNDIMKPLLLRMDSTDSTSSFGSVSSSNLGSDICRCDDCLLGIADHFASDESSGKRKVRNYFPVSY